MTPNDVIEQVLVLEQNSGLLRTPDDHIQKVLQGFVNQTILMTATYRPDLFASLGPIQTVAGNSVQSMPTDSLRLIEIFHVIGGQSVVEVSLSMMERSYPGWASERPSMPINYMRHPRNHNRYFLYPAPAQDVYLMADYVKVPKVYGHNDEIEFLSDAYMPALVYGTASMSANVLNDRVLPERVQMHRTMYEQILGVSLQAKLALDVDERRDPEDDRRRTPRNDRT